MFGRKSQAEIHVLFQEWVIPHLRAESGMRIMNELREAKRIAGPTTEASAAYILAPSQSGKSHSATHAYNKIYLIPECRASNWCGETWTDDEVLAAQQKILYVKLPPKPHLGAFVTALLDAIGDLKPSSGLVHERLRRFRLQFLNGGWELLILDSFDHLTKPAYMKFDAATETQDAIKILIEQGIPMLFIGLPSEENGILNEFQVAIRSQEIPFGPLNIEKEEDLNEFDDFLGCLDVLMVECGIFEESSYLAENYLEALHHACVGRLGLLADIIRDAAKHASRRGANRIEPLDLEYATQQNTIRTKAGTHNIFKIAREKRESQKDDFNPFDVATPRKSASGRAK